MASATPRGHIAFTVGTTGHGNIVGNCDGTEAMVEHIPGVAAWESALRTSIARLASRAPTVPSTPAAAQFSAAHSCAARSFARQVDTLLAELKALRSGGC